MSEFATCPPADRLRKLVLGKLDEAEIESLGEHLLSCDRCADTVAGLKVTDTLADALHAVPQASGVMARGSVVEAAIERACQLADQRESVSREESRTSDTNTGQLEATDVLPAKSIKSRDADPALNLAAVLAPARSPGEIGRLGNYRVLKLLDHGGMGGVFLAEDEQLQRLVALKIMKPESAASPEARQRFLREARSAAKLRHDNIVTIYHVGEDHHVGTDHGTPWLAMELLEGESLKTRLDRSGKLDVSAAVRIGRQIAEALAAAHSRGLIHRDIKPGNVWLEERTRGQGDKETGGKLHQDGSPPIPYSPLPTPSAPRVKVLDFGLARLDCDDVQLTRTGLLVGTPAFMAPEQARGDEVDFRCDLFSLGCVLYRALTGKLPFHGKDTMATLTALAMHTPSPVRELVPAVPPALDELVTRLLAKDPKQRPPSAAEVARTLAAIESALSVPPLPLGEGRGEGVPPFQLRTSNRRRPAGRSAPRVPRSALLIATAAAALLILLAVLLSVRTPYGEVIIELAPGVKADDVKIEVQGNNEVKIADATHGWAINVREGQYNVQLTGNTDRFDIDHDKITVSRNKKTHLTVTLKPTLASATGSANPKSHILNPKSSPGGFALEFNGEDSYVDLPTLRYDGSHPITLEAVIICSQIDESATVIGDLRDAGIRLNFPVDTDGNWRARGCFTVIDTVDTANAVTFESIMPRRRMHVAACLRESSVRLYIDGKLQESGRLRGSFRPSNDPLKIGALPQNQSPFGGIIDELRISKVARYTRGDFTPPTRFEPDPDTLALYHFDEGTGTELKDSSGNNHHGKIVNAKWVPGIAAGPPNAGRPAVVAGAGSGDPRPAAGSVARYALDFAGRDDTVYPHVELATIVPNQPLTVELYTTPRSVPNPGEVRALFTLRPSGFYLRQDGYAWHWVAMDAAAAGKWTIVDFLGVQTGRRVHLAGVSTGTELRLFVDGRFADKKPIGVTLGEIASNAVLGYPATSRITKPYDGTIDQARISKTARYDKNFTPPVRFEPDADTLALYHFDEGSGDELNDSSGNEHHGKIVNAKWVPGIAGGPASGATAGSSSSASSVLAGSPDPASRSTVGLPNAASTTAGSSSSAAADSNPKSKIENQKSAPDFALEFNGKDSYVDLPTLRYDGSHPITLEATVVPALESSQQTEAQFIVGDQFEGGLALMLMPRDQSSPLLRFGFSLSDNRRDATTRTYANVAGGAKISDSTHVAGVREGDRFHIFLAGKLVESGIHKGSFRPGPGAFRIGANSSPVTRIGNLFAGRVDELRVSKTARYTADYTPAARFEPDADTLALYHFDEGQGHTLTDSSGNNHHGKIVNAKWVSGIAGGPKASTVTGTNEANYGSNQSTNRGSAAADLQPTVPDRQLIEALHKEAELKLVLNSNKTIVVKPSDALPVEQYVVTGITFNTVGPKLPREFVTTVLLPAIKQLSGLTELRESTFRIPWSDEDFAAIAQASCAANLSTLEVLGLRVSPQTMTTLKHFPKLNRLRLAVLRADDNTLAEIKNLPPLTSLRLELFSTTKPMSELVAAAISSHPLTLLDVTHHDIGPHLSRAISQMPQLRNLCLGGEKLPRAHLLEIARSRTVMYVRLESPEITDESLDVLAKISTLEKIAFRNCRVTKAGIESLKVLLPNCKIDWREGN